MKEFKFTGTMHPERIQPHDRFRKEYQNLRGALMVSTGYSYPEVEVIIRVHDRRQEWIDKWYAEAKEDEKNGEILIKFCKDVTVICVYATTYSQEIACAAPRHGDKYDQHTGVAVAYAKLCNAEIPDYI